MATILILQSSSIKALRCNNIHRPDHRPERLKYRPNKKHRRDITSRRYFHISGFMKDNSIICSVNLRHTIHADLKFLVCGNVVAHFVVVELLVCDHIKIACACKAKEDSLFFACFLALHSLVYSNSDCVAALGSREDTLCSCKLFCGGEYACLLNRAGCHISVVVKL